jgi:RNA polymerase-binding transcription factor DksA
MLDLAKVTKHLEAERERLRAEIAEIKAQPATFSAAIDSYYGNHLADTATDIFEEEKALALEAHLVGLLGQIEAALDRIAKGTYGICENCGEPIDPARLEALPYATTCLSCSAASKKASAVGRA